MKRPEFEHIWLKIFLFLILGLHVWAFNKIPLQFDELLMFDLVDKFPLNQMLHYLLTTEVQMPIPYLITKLFLATGLKDTFYLRLPALLSGIALPWAFIRLASLSFSKKDSLKATCLLMLFYPLFEFSGSMRPNMLMLILAVMIIYEFKKMFFTDAHTFSRLRFYIYLFLLFFTHPFGALFTISLLGIYLYLRRSDCALSLVPIYIGTFFLSFFLFLRLPDLIYILQNKGQEYRIQKLVYIGSGFPYISVLFLLLCAYVINKKSFKPGLITRHFSRPHLIIFSAILITGTFLFLLFPTYIHPRHFLFILPSYAILTVQLLKFSKLSEKRGDALFLLLSGLLLYKSLVSEQILKRPYEIESLSIAQKAIELSENKYQILSCGNCPSYYIPGSHLKCMGPSLKTDDIAALDPKEEFVFVTFTYSRNQCPVEMFKENYEVSDSLNFRGGEVYKILPKRN